MKLFQVLLQRSPRSPLAARHVTLSYRSSPGIKKNTFNFTLYPDRSTFHFGKGHSVSTLLIMIALTLSISSFSTSWVMVESYPFPFLLPLLPSFHSVFLLGCSVFPNQCTLLNASWFMGGVSTTLVPVLVRMNWPYNGYTGGKISIWTIRYQCKKRGRDSGCRRCR